MAPCAVCVSPRPGFAHPHSYFAIPSHKYSVVCRETLFPLTPPSLVPPHTTSLACIARNCEAWRYRPVQASGDAGEPAKQTTITRYHHLSPCLHPKAIHGRNACTPMHGYRLSSRNSGSFQHLCDSPLSRLILATVQWCMMRAPSASSSSSCPPPTWRAPAQHACKDARKDSCGHMARALVCCGWYCGWRYQNLGQERD